MKERHKGIYDIYKYFSSNLVMSQDKAKNRKYSDRKLHKESNYLLVKKHTESDRF